MDKNWKDVGLDLLLVVIWFGSAYFSFSAFGVAEWALYAALINVIIGSLLLFIATRTESGFWQLYKGVKDDEEVGFNIALMLLMIVPVACATAGIGWWLLRLLGLFEY